MKKKTEDETEEGAYGKEGATVKREGGEVYVEKQKHDRVANIK